MSNSIKKINNLNFHATTNAAGDSFVGVKIRNGKIDFYYPNTYDLATEDDVPSLRKDILSILSTISVANTLSRDIIKIESTYSNNESISLISYIWKIREFLKNGFYINREKTYKTNQKGRVDWKKTLDTETIISGGNIIYRDMVVQVLNDNDNLLVEIDKYCVKKSIDFIGWLFGIYSSDFIKTKPFNKKLYVYTLKQELHKTFDDNKKLNLLHMLKIVEGLSEENDFEKVVYGVDSYHHIFEEMIDRMFGNRKSSDFNPSATWQLKKNQFTEKKARDLRPDTILVKDDVVYVLDAKFYQFGFTGKDDDMPETTSIQKQITYGEYIKQNKLGDDIKKIRNAFILPYNKNNNKFDYNNNIEYIGYSKTNYKKNNEEHEIVHAFLIDLKYVISNFSYAEHKDEIEQLVDEIEKNIVHH